MDYIHPWDETRPERPAFALYGPGGYSLEEHGWVLVPYGGDEDWSLWSRGVYRYALIGVKGGLFPTESDVHAPTYDAGQLALIVAALRAEAA